MRLQIASQLAVYALLELAAHPDRQLSVGDIGEKYNISSHHLAKVMKVLGRAKFVRSVRGARGGYQFIGNARRMTLLDIIQLFEDLGSSTVDSRGLGKVTNEVRALRDVVREIDDIARSTLGSITIATMLKLVDRHRPETATRTDAAALSER
jgi:Rrf2 family protein